MLGHIILTSIFSLVNYFSPKVLLYLITVWLTFVSATGPCKCESSEFSDYQHKTEILHMTIKCFQGPCDVMCTRISSRGSLDHGKTQSRMHQDYERPSDLVFPQLVQKLPCVPVWAQSSACKTVSCKSNILHYYYPSLVIIIIA